MENPFCENTEVQRVLQIVGSQSLSLQTRMEMLFFLMRCVQQWNEVEQAYILRQLRDVHAHTSHQEFREYLALCFALLGDRTAYRSVVLAFVQRGKALPLWWQDIVRAYLRQLA